MKTNASRTLCQRMVPCVVVAVAIVLCAAPTHAQTLRTPSFSNLPHDVAAVYRVDMGAMAFDPALAVYMQGKRRATDGMIFREILDERYSARDTLPGDVSVIEGGVTIPWIEAGNTGPQYLLLGGRFDVEAFEAFLAGKGWIGLPNHGPFRVWRNTTESRFLSVANSGTVVVSSRLHDLGRLLDVRLGHVPGLRGGDTPIADLIDESEFTYFFLASAIPEQTRRELASGLRAAGPAFLPPADAETRALQVDVLARIIEGTGAVGASLARDDGGMQVRLYVEHVEEGNGPLLEGAFRGLVSMARQQAGMGAMDGFPPEAGQALDSLSQTEITTIGNRTEFEITLPATLIESALDEAFIQAGRR